MDTGRRVIRKHRGRPADTDERAWAVQTELLRRATPARRFATAMALSRMVIHHSRRALRRLHPDWSEREIGLEWVALHYGRDLADRVRRYVGEREA